jgi:hypothetical protein
MPVSRGFRKQISSTCSNKTGKRKRTIRVYVLQHAHAMDDAEDDFKFIGVYSSRENAQAAIKRLSRAPGFADAVSGFHIDEYEMDKDQWVEGYSTLASA